MGVKRLWGDIPEWTYLSVRSILESLKKVDPLTYHHCLRVGEYARKLARDAGLNPYEQKLAEFAGMLHDIGKIGISQNIIHKPGKLDNLENEHMCLHPIYSEEIVKPLAHHPFFAEILPAIRGHHERIDGTGYPDKKRGDEVPLIARIILIVDTLDAMSETRSYRKGLPIDVVYKELKKYAGSQFDERLVKIFLEAHPNWAGEQVDQETVRKIKKAA